MAKTSCALEGLRSCKEVLDYLDRIDWVEEIQFLKKGEIVHLKSCPRNIDIIFSIKNNLLPELIEDDFTTGIIILIDNNLENYQAIRHTTIDQLHELHASVFKIARKMYLTNEKKRQQWLEII